MRLVHAPAEMLAWLAGMIPVVGQSNTTDLPAWWIEWRWVSALGHYYEVSACEWTPLFSCGVELDFSIFPPIHLSALHLLEGRTRKWFAKLMQKQVNCPRCKVLYDAVTEANR